MILGDRQPPQALNVPTLLPFLPKGHELGLLGPLAQVGLLEVSGHASASAEREAHEWSSPSICLMPCQFRCHPLGTWTTPSGWTGTPWWTLTSGRTLDDLGLEALQPKSRTLLLNEDGPAKVEAALAKSKVGSLQRLRSLQPMTLLQAAEAWGSGASFILFQTLPQDRTRRAQSQMN